MGVCACVRPHRTRRALGSALRRLLPVLAHLTCTHPPPLPHAATHTPTPTHAHAHAHNPTCTIKPQAFKGLPQGTKGLSTLGAAVTGAGSNVVPPLNHCSPQADNAPKKRKEPTIDLTQVQDQNKDEVSTPTLIPTRTLTLTLTLRPILTLTPTLTLTLTVTPTLTLTLTVTPTLTLTPTLTHLHLHLHLH